MDLKKIFSAVFFALLMLAAGVPAYAHIGPPFPIIENKRVGPVVIALWTHPDIGQSPFYVMIDPAPGSKVPGDLKVKIGIEPENHRFPETFYDGERDETRNQVVYKVLVNFDRDEFYKVHLIIQSAQGQGEAFSRVEATPTLMGRFGLVFFAMPFVAIGVMWYKGVSKKRKQQMKRRQAAQASKATAVNQ